MKMEWKCRYVDVPHGCYSYLGQNIYIADVKVERELHEQA